MDESAAEKIIDWAMIMDVCGYESLVKKIIPLSLKDAGQTMKLLAKAIKACNSEDVTLYAHRLKGVAMTMGAAKLAEKTQSIECAGNEKDLVNATSAFHDLEEEAETVI